MDNKLWESEIIQSNRDKKAFFESLEELSQVPFVQTSQQYRFTQEKPDIIPYPSLDLSDFRYFHLDSLRSELKSAKDLSMSLKSQIKHRDAKDKQESSETLRLIEERKKERADLLNKIKAVKKKTANLKAKQKETKAKAQLFHERETEMLKKIEEKNNVLIKSNEQLSESIQDYHNRVQVTQDKLSKCQTRLNIAQHQFGDIEITQPRTPKVIIKNHRSLSPRRLHEKTDICERCIRHHKDSWAQPLYLKYFKIRTKDKKDAKSSS